MKAGDTVRYLNATGGGKVVKIEGNIAYVAEDDGFETPVLVKECVVVDPDGGITPKRKFGSNEPSKYEAPAVTHTRQAAPEKEQTPEAEETPEGETLNIVLGYEAAEIKHLNTSTFDAYIVNDSNYYLYLVYASRCGDGIWDCRYNGIVEPNTQVLLEELTHDDLTDLERVSIQYVAFKQGKAFKLKNPAAVEFRVDATKFYKMHCFHENMYFDNPVIAFDIVKNDVPQRTMIIDSSMLEQAMREKKAADKPAKKPVTKHTGNNKKGEIIEVDLHINELLDSANGLSNKDMLDVQLNEFRRVMNDNIRNKGQKIVFIHGKGEGVLRKALLDELRHKYKNCDAQDASFREYGFGATLITVH